MYVKITNGAVEQYPYTLGNLRRDNPNTSFPRNPNSEVLAEWGVHPVTVEAEPSYDRATQKLVQQTPSLVDGVWVVTWQAQAKTSDEIANDDARESTQMRLKRDGLLAETDFYALSDVTMSAEMTTYRQALRDITSHANWPYLDGADWPTKP